MTTGLIGGALALAVLWAIGLRLLPVTLWRDDLDSNAKNWPGLIVMRRGLPVPGAVWAQEFYEARHRWRWLPLSLILIRLGRLWPRLAKFERRMEAMGHEAEVWAEWMLAKSDPAATRMREVDALTRYAVFEGVPPAQIEAAMRAREKAARAFVQKHERRIRKMNQRGLRRI